MDEQLANEISTARIIPIKTSCCRSYRLPKGRCYDCVEEGWDNNVEK
jgi:hypothetical protein